MACPWSCACDPPPPLIKVASNTRPRSKLGGTTLNGREEGGQYYISQTCDPERFEARKVVFLRECFNIFATGCSYSLPEWRVVKPTFFAPCITDVSNLGDFAFTLGSKTHNIRAIQLVLQLTSCTFLLAVLPLRDGGTKTQVTFPQVRVQGYHDTADKWTALEGSPSPNLLTKSVLY